MQPPQAQSSPLSPSLSAFFSRLTELAADAVGGKILFATDDFFAVAENMISREEPIWDSGKFTEFGKWMDGWETRRKRIPGHDWCILELGLSGTIEGVEVDTAYFTGNNTPRVSIQAACLEPGQVCLTRRSEMGTAATSAEIRAAEAVASDQWETVLPMSNLKPGYQETRHNLFKINGKGRRWTHLRVNMHPDGGIARLRVYGNVMRGWSCVKTEDRVDLVSVTNGGKALLHSDAHYGKPTYCLGLGRAAGMFDGWETARNPNRPPAFKMGQDGCLVAPGSQWAVFELGHQGIIDEIEIDTYHFKGNYPESCLVEACKHQTISHNDELSEDDVRSWPWFTVLPRSPLSPHEIHVFKPVSVANGKLVTHIRLTIFPDGGVSRMRIWGHVSRL